MIKTLAPMLALTAVSQAQGLLQTTPVQAPIRNLGTYHVSSQTWVRGTPTAGFGPDVLYNNVGPSWYIHTVPDHRSSPYSITDGGRIPSLSDTGTGASYTVDGLKFGYCTQLNIGNNLSVRFGFDESLEPCSGPGLSSLRSLSLAGLPTTPVTGLQSCWTVTIDLSGSSAEFTIAGDGDGLFEPSGPGIDEFAVTLEFYGHGLDATTGPLVFGRPDQSPFGDGTTDFGYGPGPDGSGLGQYDGMWIETSGLSGPDCYWFGGYPTTGKWAGLYLRLYGSSNATGSPLSFCEPLGGNSVSSGGAVLSSSSGFGTASASFDLFDVPDQPGALTTGTTVSNTPFGCGQRCVGGSARFGPVFVPSGQQALGVPFDMSAADSVLMQYFYRDPANLAACGATWNLSNGLRP